MDRGPAPASLDRKRPARFRSVATIGVLSALTLGLGFAVQVVLAAQLGATAQMDIFLVAIALPTLVTNVSVSALSLALVPVFTERMASGSVGGALALGKRLAVSITPPSLLLGAVLAIAAGPIVRVLAPGFDGPATDQAASLLRLMSLAVVLDLYRAALGPLYYAQERFFYPQVAPVFNHLVMIAAVTLLFPRMGLEGLALGWVAGSGLMILVLLMGLARAWRAPAEDPGPGFGLRGIASAVWPSTVIALAAQAIPVVDRAVATTLAQGSVSYLGYGIKMLEVALRTAPMALVLAAFPRMSGLFSAGDREGLQREVTSTSRWILLTMAPLSILVTSLRLPLVRMLFERGAFDESASEGVATAVGWYGVALVPASMLYLAKIVMFAVRRPRSIATIGAASVIATAALDVVLSQVWGFRGIAVAYVLVASLSALGAALVLARSRDRIVIFPDAAWLGKVALASGVSLAAVLAAIAFFPPSELGGLGNELAVVAGTVAGLLTYLAILWLTGCQEIVHLRAGLRTAAAAWLQVVRR